MELTDLKAAIDDYSEAAEQGLFQLKEEIDSIKKGLAPSCPSSLNVLKEYEDFVKHSPMPYESPLSVAALGLAEEAGEVAGKVKRVFRGEPPRIQDLEKELGDTLWYLTKVAQHFELNLEGIMLANVKKLEDRRARGATLGQGDER